MAKYLNLAMQASKVGKLENLKQFWEHADVSTHTHTHSQTPLYIAQLYGLCIVLHCFCLHLKSTRQTDVTLDLNLMPSVSTEGGRERDLPKAIAINKSGLLANGQYKERTKTQNKMLQASKRAKRQTTSRPKDQLGHCA